MGLKKYFFSISLFFFCFITISLSNEILEPNTLSIVQEARVYLNNSSRRNRSRRNRSRTHGSKEDHNESLIVEEEPDQELVTLIEPSEIRNKQESSQITENQFSNDSLGDTHNHTHSHTHTHNHTHSHNHSYVRTRSINKTIPEVLNTTVPEHVNQETHEGVEPRSSDKINDFNIINTNLKNSQINDALTILSEEEKMNKESLVSLSKRHHHSRTEHHNKYIDHSKVYNNETVNHTQNSTNTTRLIQESLTFLSYNLSSDIIQNHISADRTYNSRIFKQRSYEDFNDESTLSKRVNNSYSTNYTSNYTGKYIIPVNSNLTHRQREKMRRNLEKQSHKIRKSAHYAVKNLRKEFRDSNRRMDKVYNSLKHRYRDQDERKIAFHSEYNRQRQRIKEAYMKAEERIRENAERSLDKYAKENGFDKTEGTSNLTSEEFHIEETLNETLNEELDHLEDVKNEELQNLDKAYNIVANRNNIEVENNRNSSSGNKINYLIQTHVDFERKKEIYGKIHKENYKAVIMLLIVLLICALLSIFVNWNKKKYIRKKKLRLRLKLKLRLNLNQKERDLLKRSQNNKNCLK